MSTETLGPEYITVETLTWSTPPADLTCFMCLRCGQMSTATLKKCVCQGGVGIPE